MFWGGVERDGEVSCVAGLMLTSGVTRTSWDLLGGGRRSLQPRRTGSVAADDSHPPRQAERGTNHHLRGTVVVVEDSGLAMGLNKKVAIVTGANTGIGRCNLRFIWFFFEYF